VYVRRTGGGRVLTFDFARGLRHDNLLFVDRETESLWSQIEGRAIAGPLEGEPLEVLVARQSTWGPRARMPRRRSIATSRTPSWPAI